MLITIAGGSVWEISADFSPKPLTFLTGQKTSVDPSQLVRRENGEVWFAHQDQYGQLQDGVVTNLVRLKNKSIGLCPSRDGGMWMAVANELVKYTAPSSSSNLHVQLPAQAYDVTALFEDRSGRVWLGTRNNGLFYLKQNEFQPVRQQLLAIQALFEDQEGNLWVGTESGGLHKLRPLMFRMLDMKYGLAQNSVHSVCQDKNGYGWTVLRNGGVARFEEESPTVTVSAVDNLSVSVVAPDPAGGIWLGARNGGVVHLAGDSLVQKFKNAGGFGNREARVFYTDRENRLWVGLGRSGVLRYADEKFRGLEYFRTRGLTNRLIMAITQDKNGVLWFGSLQGDLLQFKEERFTPCAESGQLTGATIGSLYASADDSLWIGTSGSGLGRLRNGKLKFASIKDGLLDNVISQIAEDDMGYFWLGCTRGVFRVNKAELDLFMDGKRDGVESISYGRADGLVNIECPSLFQPSVWKTRAGRLWFATSKGVLQIDPAHLAANTNPPPLVLEKVLVDNAPTPAAPMVTLGWNHKKMQFKYTALSFRSPEKVSFRRQLVGFDSDWINDGPVRSATYSRLAPGKYEFRFTACNDSGIWNGNPVALAFEVKPAVWQTGWFRLAVVLLFAGLVAAAARSISTLRMRRQLKRLEQVHALDRERARIARDLHDDLGARLTQMAFLTDLAATEPAADGAIQTQLREVSAQARQATRSLDETVWMVNPQKDSLPHLVEYIGHYANEFFRSTPILCRQHICMNPPDCSLPGEWRQHIFFAVKEALNNVRKHSGATEVWVRISVHRPFLRIVIADNGKGFSPSIVNDSRQGLVNLQHRLKAAGGRCVLRSAPGRGTRMTLLVKLPFALPQRNAGAP